MILLEVFYVAIATIGVMFALQLATFLITRMIHPPEAKVVYIEKPQQMYSPPPPIQVSPPPSFVQPVMQNGPALTQTQQEIQLPEYEPRKPASESLRMDLQLPDGLQETRPPGT